MSKLIVVGAGSLGREIATWLVTHPGSLAGHEVAGYLSDDPTALDNYPKWRGRILGRIDDYQADSDTLLVMAIAKPQSKLLVAEKLLAKGARFTNYIHPSAILSDPVTLGQGIVICPNAVVSCDAVLGDFVTINVGCTIGHDVRVGRGVTLSSHVDLTGFVQVEEGAFFGSHASVLPKGKIGAFSCVGAGSVVLRSVKAGCTVIGVPSKQIFP